MDVTNRFSLRDFLGYFFPGVVGTLGIYILLLLTPLRQVVSFVASDLTSTVLILALSYVSGIILAGFSGAIVRWILRIRRLEEPRDSIPLSEIRAEIIDALRDVLKVKQGQELKWSTNYYLLCRSLVQEIMPNATQVISRQDGLRQFRENMIAPTLIWFLAGVSWGIWSVFCYSIMWGVLLILASTSLSYITIMSLVDRMWSNRERAVRETYTAFLMGYKVGLFRDAKVKDAP